MNKAALVEEISVKIPLSMREVSDVLEAFQDIVISQTKAGEIVTLPGFGAFSARTRAGRIGVNPQNPSEKIEIKPVVVPKFKPGKRFKDTLKQ